MNGPTIYTHAHAGITITITVTVTITISPHTLETPRWEECGREGSSYSTSLFPHPRNKTHHKENVYVGLPAPKKKPKMRNPHMQKLGRSSNPMH